MKSPVSQYISSIGEGAEWFLGAVDKSAFGRKGVALIFAVLFVSSSFSSFSSSEPFSYTAESQGAPYGDLEYAHRMGGEYLDNSSVKSDVEPFLEDWTVSADEIPDPGEGLSIEYIEREYPIRPSVLDAADDFHPEEDIDGLGFISFLASEPLSYYIYIPYHGNDSDWHMGRFWDAPIDLIWFLLGLGGNLTSNWVDINITEPWNSNPTTDISVRLTLNLRVTGLPLASGGFTLEVDKKNPRWNRETDIYFLKGFNYTSRAGGVDEKNKALLSLKAGFLELPDYAEIKVHATELEFNANILEMLRNPDTIGADEMFEITGPVEITWNFASDVPSFSGQFIFLEANETEGIYLQNWFDIDITPGYGKENIPRNGRLEAATTNPKKGFQHIKWECPEKTNITISFVEEKEDTIYAFISLEDVATSFTVDITEKTVEEGNLTVIEYSASSVIPLISFRNFQYIGTKIHELEDNSPMLHVNVQIRDMPMKLYAEGTFEMEEMESPYVPPYPSVGYVINILIQRIVARFSRISRTVSSMPEKILQSAGEGGYFVLDAETPMEVSFLLTDGERPFTDDPEQDFFAFLNATGDVDIGIVVGGRIGGLRKMAGIIGEEADGTLDIVGRGSLQGFYIDEPRDFVSKVEIAQIPENITVQMSKGNMVYRGSGRDNRFSYSSRHKDLYMLVDVLDIPSHLSMKRAEDAMAITTHGGGIGMVKILVTDTTPMSMEGSHMFAERTPEHMRLSLALHNISSLSYNRTSGFFSMELDTPGSLKMMVSSSVDIDAFMKILIDPLPTKFSAELPDTVNTTDLEIPDISTQEGIMSIPNILFSINEIGYNIIDTMDTVMADAISGFGDADTEISLSYAADRTTDITALILYDQGKEEDVVWTHGISAKQTEHNGNVSFAGKIFLPGLPKIARLNVDTRDTRTMFSIDLEDYMPRYNWLMFDVKGLDGRDARLSISDLPPVANIFLDVDLTMEMQKGGGKVNGGITSSILHHGMPASLGMLHLYAIQEHPIRTTVDMLLPIVPSSMDMNMFMEGDVIVDYTASDIIPYMYIAASRPFDDRVAGVSLLFRDIPRRMRGTVVPRRDLDIDGSMLQSVPDIIFTSSSPGLDIFVSGNGEFMGQRGRYSLRIIDMSTFFSGRLRGDTYHITGGKTGLVEIMAMDVPYSKQVQIHEIVIRVEEIDDVKITITPMFGFYPIIDIENSGTKTVEFLIRAKMMDREANGVFISMAFRKGALGSIPGYPNFMVNGGVLPMSGVPRQIMLFDPGMSLMLTMLLGGWL